MRQDEAYVVYSEATKPGSAADMDEFFVDGVRRIRSDLFRVANSILRSPADAEDALSESIVKAYAKRHTLRGREKFKFWMMKILVRECYALRKVSRLVVCTDALPDTVEASAPPARELWDVVAGLPDEFRVAVVLFYYEDLGTKDIAKLLRVSEGTVKSRLFRARERLRALLGDDGRPGGE